jgi:hypothetical protein
MKHCVPVMNTSQHAKRIQGAKSRFLFVFIGLLTVVAGISCAPHSHEIRSSEISPEKYRDYSCTGIYAEMNLHLRNLQELGREIDEEAETDETQTAVGVILFWPVLFWLEGSDTPEAQEYAQLRGEMLALEHTAILKDCVEAKALATAWHQKEEALRAEMERKKKERQMQHTFGEE